MRNALFVVFALFAGCGPKEVVIKIEGPDGKLITLPANLGKISPMVVVGDPTKEPGMTGGPCKDESCGHSGCDRARKFVTETKCVFCKKSLGWGKEIRAVGDEGKSDRMVWHDQCGETTLCAACEKPLGNRKFSLAGGVVKHNVGFDCKNIMPDEYFKHPNRRTWTTKDGKFKTEAEWVDSANGKATLKKANGKTIVIEIDKLSDADQVFLGVGQGLLPSATP